MVSPLLNLPGFGGGSGGTVDQVARDAAAAAQADVDAIETRLGAVTLTASGGVVAIDALSGQFFRVTLDGNHQIADPANLYPGWRGAIEITQDATGNRVPTWASAWTWPGGTAPALSTAAGAVDVVIGVSFDGATIRAALAAADFS